MLFPSRRQTLGVNHIEETEDYIESIGHLADYAEEANFDEEVREGMRIIHS